MNRFDELKIDEETITVAQHEKEMTRMETANKRWFISFLVVLFMLFATNIGWVIYESQFQDVTITQDGYSEGNGTNVFNGTGEVRYGDTGTPDNQDPGET